MTARWGRMAAALALPVLALALLTFLVILVFRPQLYEFGADRTSLVAGEALTLRWNASP